MTQESQARIEALEDRVVALEAREAILIECCEKMQQPVERLFQLLVDADIVERHS